jgi:hypothetical protein
MKSKLVVVALLSGFAAAGAANASFISFGAGGSSPDGSVSASAQFTTSNNGTLTIALNNLLSGIVSPGQMLSDIAFTFGGQAPGTVTLTSQSGALVNVNNSTVTPVSGSPTHWVYSGGVLTAISGGQPSNMIVGPSPNCNNGCANFNPYINQTATFVLTGATLTAATTITGATFSFGTGPEFFLPGTVCTSPTQPNCGDTPPSVPEPNSSGLALLGLALLVFGTFKRRPSPCM